MKYDGIHKYKNINLTNEIQWHHRYKTITVTTTIKSSINMYKTNELTAMHVLKM